MDEKLEQQILKIIKQNENIWVSELWRELTRQKISIDYHKLSEILKELERGNVITFEFIGRNKVVRLKRKETRT